MGKRKRERAEEYKQQRSIRAFAVLRNCPLPARKVRLVADLVRGVEVNRALGVLRYTERNSSPYLEKLLLSALANWQVKNEDKSPDDERLFVKTIMVDEGRTLKRIRPRAQGRAGRILKRSCHVRLELGTFESEEGQSAGNRNAEKVITEQE